MSARAQHFRASRVRRFLLLAVVAGVLSAIGQAALAQGAGTSSSQLDPRWISSRVQHADPPSSSTPDAAKNNTIADALGRRDQAVAQWRAAVGRYNAAVARAHRARGKKARARLTKQAAKLAPSPFAKPEYVVVWMSHENASDENQHAAQTDLGLLSQDPAQWTSDSGNRFAPGQDGFAVLDARRRNLDGSPNTEYGKVVNLVQLPVPWGVEAEAHHMQYQWEDGQPLLAGGLFNTTTFILGTGQIPDLNLLNTLPPQATPNGTIPDAYDAAGNGDFIGTYMGGPEPNYASSPGEVVAFKPDPQKGLVVASETAAGVVGATEGAANPGGVPETCNDQEGFPNNTCANPHGIQVRPDLGRMVTSDYGEPKAVVLDPVKFDGGRFYRPTIRIWDTSDPLKPKLVSVAHVPIGWRDPESASTMHLNRGIMENAKTWPRTKSFPTAPDSKGAFAGSMCGGGVFFTPDITKLKGDSTNNWNEVWDDGMSLAIARGANVQHWLQNEGPCEGGAWMQVSRNNRYLFRIVTGNQPSDENTYSNGQPNKVVYDLNVERLIKDAQRGHVACDLIHGTDTNGDGHVDIAPKDMLRQMAAGQQVSDCPRFVSALNVDDPTTGGPHWGAIDNHSLTADGSPTRLVFADYFVSRSGVDGDHRLYSANIDPATGKLSYDESWRDEITGQLGVNFNRADWPNNPGAGFYKPHSMVWVCPPGVCPADKPAVGFGRASAAKPKKHGKHGHRRTAGRRRGGKHRRH